MYTPLRCSYVLLLVILEILIAMLTNFICCRYRRKRDRLIERASVARLPLKWGNVHAYCYKSVIDGIEHIAMVKVSHCSTILPM
jgi:hypothetical protein